MLPERLRPGSIVTRLRETLTILEQNTAISPYSTSTFNQKLATLSLRGIIAAYLVGTIFLPGLITPLLFPFALIHGTRRYGWKIIGVFMMVTFIVVTVLESASILNGFPLGRYYYTSLLGPKVGLIPVFVYVSYLGLGYLAWLLSTILGGEVRKGSTVLVSLVVPLVASLIMVAWDFSADPIGSTVKHAWIWTQGGAYFGVPFSNFVGWGLTVYVLFQLFALYMRHSGPEDLGPRLPPSYYLQAVLVYMWTGVGFVFSYFLRPMNSMISDAVGHVWQTGDIYAAAATSAVATMIPVSILAVIVLRYRLIGKESRHQPFTSATVSDVVDR